MPLTRHLYREDEVVAALAWCILRGRQREAAFWALELLDSGLLEEFAGVARWIWAFAFALTVPAWLAAFESALAGEEVDATTLIHLVVRLTRAGTGAAGRDASAVALLAVPTDLVPDRVCPTLSEIGATEVERFLERAVNQGRTVAAWQALRACEEADRWDLLDQLAVERCGTPAYAAAWISPFKSADLPGELGLAVALAGLCLPRFEMPRRLDRELPPVTAEVLADLEEWSALTGRRARRAHTIPVDCLYWLTARGREQSVYDSNEKELMGRLEKGKGIWNSTFWDGVAAELGGWQVIRDDDEVREAFYAEHFPDDIPDEWPKGDRAKSHGGGVLQRGATPTAAEWVRRWFGGLRCEVVWDGVATGIARMRDGVGATTAGDIEALWAPQTIPPEVVHATWNLRPAKRVIELAS